MEGRIETATATPRFRTFLVVVFAGVALMLAMAGVYSVMAYTVSQRIPELGVRVALGATPASIMRLILAQGAKLAAAGLALGLALSLLSTRMLEGLLFGVPPRDPITLALVTVAVAVAMLLATYIPGRRAVRVDPLTRVEGGVTRRVVDVRCATCHVPRATASLRRATRVRLATSQSDVARRTSHVARPVYSARAASRA